MEKVILEKIKATEKIVRQIETENCLVFVVDRAVSKEEIKAEVESLFDVKVAGVRTSTQKNKKQAFVKLKPKFSAGDLATKLGVL
ncbi:50S ribosomal protein L23 [archaeon]|jgi:large subunit ribosomal protein L23|nr:50S ribosomal protein L23 [archaeon]